MQHKGWTYKDDERAKKRAVTAQREQQRQQQQQQQQGGMLSAAAAAAAAHQHPYPPPLLQAAAAGGGLGMGLLNYGDGGGGVAGLNHLLQLLPGMAAATTALPPAMAMAMASATTAPAPLASLNTHLAPTGMMGTQQQQQQQQHPGPGHADLSTIGFVAGAALGAAAAARQQQGQGQNHNAQPQQPSVSNEVAQQMIASFLVMQQQGLQQQQSNIVNQAAFALRQQVLGQQMAPLRAVGHTNNPSDGAQAKTSSDGQDGVGGTYQETSQPQNPKLNQADSTGGASNTMPLLNPNIFPGGGTGGFPPQQMDLSVLGGNMHAYLLQQQQPANNNINKTNMASPAVLQANESESSANLLGNI